MKKSAFLCILCLMLCACGNSQTAVQTEQFTLDTASIPQNTGTIEKILNENVWNYDEDSLSFGNDLILSDRGENFEAICAASEAAGIDTKRLKNGAKQTMLATVELLNSDMSSAGTAYFAFSKQELLCGYYMYNNVCQSLANKYPFEYASPFSASENKEISRSFSQTDARVPFENVEDIYSGDTVVLSGSSIIFYESTQNGMKKSGKADFGDELMPVSVAVGRELVCVLLDSYDVADNSESEYEVSEDGPDIINKKSEKIVFVDKNGDYTAPEILLDLSIYSSVDVTDSGIAAARNNAIDIFERESGGWTKTARLSVDIAVEKMRVADIDGDGTEEYIISDGVNLYVYTGAERLMLAWNKKFGLSAIKDFFAADLNGDGVKEIYVNDSNGFVTRYVLGTAGFEAYGGGIAMGENAYYAAGDLDGNGLDDYLTVTEDEMKIYR